MNEADTSCDDAIAAYKVAICAYDDATAAFNTASAIYDKATAAYKAAKTAYMATRAVSSDVIDDTNVQAAFEKACMAENEALS